MTTTYPALESRLRSALHAEVDRVVPSPSGLLAIRHRIYHPSLLDCLARAAAFVLPRIRITREGDTHA